MSRKLFTCRAAKPFLDDAGLSIEVHVSSNRRHGRSGTV